MFVDAHHSGEAMPTREIPYPDLYYILSAEMSLYFRLSFVGRRPRNQKARSENQKARSHFIIYFILLRIKGASLGIGGTALVYE